MGTAQQQHRRRDDPIRAIFFSSVNGSSVGRNPRDLEKRLLVLLAGFFHEQARWDRDKFVKIYWENILEGTLNPFTPESDQCQNSPAASQKIWHHTVWRSWLFIAYSDENWLYYKFSLHHSYNRFLKGWENTLFELRSERVNKQPCEKISKGPATRGGIVRATLCPKILPVPGKTRRHCCAPRGHKKCFWRLSKTVWCPPQMLRTRVNMITSLPSQWFRYILANDQYLQLGTIWTPRKYAFLSCGHLLFESAVTAQNDEFTLPC